MESLFPLLSESQISFFKFWFNGNVYDGLSYQGELFSRFHTFSLYQKPHVCRLGSNLAQEGIDVLVTLSENQYSLWTNLRIKHSTSGADVSSDFGF